MSYYNRTSTADPFEDFIVNRRHAICHHPAQINQSQREELFSHQKLSAGINFQKDQEIPIEVENFPLPAEHSFDDLSLTPELRENVKLCGYADLTPVQRASLPLGLQGVDLLTCAQTGSGKTAAFLIPVISSCQRLNAHFEAQGPHHARKRSKNYRHHPLAVLLTPTRELAKQVYLQAVRLCHNTGVLPAIVYGGVSKGGQLRNLRSCHGVDILIGTPGRVHDFIRSEEISLASAFACVLDEADRMLDMGFYDQITGVLSDGGFPEKLSQSKHAKVEKELPSRQVLMFSATFPKPIQELAREFLADRFAFVRVGVVGVSNADVKQEFLFCPSREEKVEKLLEVLAATADKALVFVNRKRDADELEYELRSKMPKGVRVFAIHGDKSQDQRDTALRRFKENTHCVLLATDVAARGLDVPNVAVVINFDLAPEAEQHVHRVGRTGRCGNTGLAVTLVSDKENKNIGGLVGLLKKEGNNVPDFLEKLAMRGGPSRGFGGGFRRGRGRGRNDRGFRRGGNWRRY